jgi:hypothetical protein
MNKKQTLILVQKELANLKFDKQSVDYVVLEDKTIKKDWGWVFFYPNKAYLRSGDSLDMLAGNAPIIINRKTAQLMHTGTAHTIEFYINEYEETFSF